MARRYWTCIGSVRGECNVRHRTRRAAERHCFRDMRDVRNGHGQYSYSDRRPVEVALGEQDDNETEE